MVKGIKRDSKCMAMESQGKRQVSLWRRLPFMMVMRYIAIPVKRGNGSQMD